MYYERPAGFHKNALIHEAQLIGALIAMLEEKQIPYSALSPSEIKKHATGKGNANKDLMVEAAKKRFPLVEVIDDNHADALWIHDLAKTLYHS